MKFKPELIDAAPLLVLRTSFPRSGGRKRPPKHDRHHLNGNKVRNEDERLFLETETPGLPVLGMMPADLGVQEADRLGIPVFDHVPALRQAVESMAQQLDAVLVKGLVE